MSRLFHSKRDIKLFDSINKELIQKLMDTCVDIYIYDDTFAKIDVYNDVFDKLYYKDIQISGIIDHPEVDIDFENFQEKNYTITVKFHKNTLKEYNNLDEKLKPSDLIKYNDKYFKIVQITNNQFIGGQTNLKHSLICYCVQTNDSKNYVDKVEKYTALINKSKLNIDTTFNDTTEILNRNNIYGE